MHERTVQLPAPMRDARVLRTLALLDLESHPPPAAVDRVAVGVDVTEGRVLQFGLFARALPTGQAGDAAGASQRADGQRSRRRAGAGRFLPARRLRDGEVRAVDKRGTGIIFDLSARKRLPSPVVIRRFRSPIPARVTLEQGRPVRVTTDRRGFSGGRVETLRRPVALVGRVVESSGVEL